MASFGHGASHRHRQKLSHQPYSFSPLVFKAKIKLAGKRLTAHFACGAESLAASAVRRLHARQQAQYIGKIFTAT